ncbi:PUA-like domain-containing protein [Linnemannia elongata]|nr:PUA-like domain-containing protein [Linnemannia elongata]
MLPLQCRICKYLLHNPITLPCGFTACQACLPPLQSIAFRQQIHCPFPACARSNIHSADQLSIDVTLQSLTTAWRAACLQEDLHTGTLSSSTSSASSAHVAVAPPILKDLETSSEPAPTPNFYQHVSQVIETLRPKIQQETECQVCFLVFDQPLTTSCGHTLCKSCLITSLDHNPNCPLCRRKLPLYMFYHNQPVNKALVRLINFMVRQSAENEIEGSSSYATTTTSAEEQRDLDPNLAMTPLFINSLIFPRMPCYLLVFEPRYRRMLRNVLKTESKVFGMVLPPQQRKQHRFAMDEAVTRWEPSREYGTLLKIVSLELLPDGRALVETIGLSRFQILTYSMLDGYYTATAVELIDDISEEQERGQEKAVMDVATLRLEQVQRSMTDDHDGSTEAFSAYRDKDNTIDSDTDSDKGESSGDEDTEEQLLDRRRSRNSQRSSPLSTLSPSLTRSERSIPTSTNPVNARFTTVSAANASTSSQPSRTEEQPPANAQDEEEQEVVLGLKDLHNVELELVSQKQLMQILQGFVSHMQDRLGPLATQRLEREFGEMIEDDGRSFSFWVGSILPVRQDQKYELLKQTSVRQRLQTVLGWIREIEARRSLAVCSIQ